MSLLLLLLVPLIGAALAWLTRPRGADDRDARPAAVAIVAVGALLVTLSLGIWVAVSEPAVDLSWGPVIRLSLAAQGFSRVMVILVPAIATPVLVYATATQTVARPRLLAMMLAFVAAMLLLVVADDFVSLLIGWELVSAISWWLIGHDWRERGDVDAATQSFLTTHVGDLSLYLAAGAVFAATGSFAFDGVALAGSPWAGIIAGGVLFAAAAKSAQVPFSPWLFAAMAGPTPVSALLHSATLVASGAYLLIRLAPSLDSVTWFLPATVLVGATTAIGGGLVATVQPHLKRTLAASTSAQYGLMFIAVGAGSAAAAGAQLVTHAAFKSLLFLAAGVAIHATGSHLFGRVRLGRAMPIVAAAATIGALALAGLPPLGGGWSKEAIVAVASGASPVLGALTLAAGFLTAVYAARFLLLTYGPGERPDRIARPSPIVLAPMVGLAVATMVLGLLWLPDARSTIERLAGSGLATGTFAELILGIGLVVAGVLLAVAFDRHGRLLDLGLGGPVRAAVAEWLSLPRATSMLVVHPTLRLSAALARADDRVVDAGVRGAARVAGAVSSLTAGSIESTIDGLARATAMGTMRLAGTSRWGDDTALDGTVEATGRAVGLAGRHSRRLQGGETHRYYVLVVIGFACIAVLLSMYR